MNNKKKYAILAFLLTCLAVTSCIDDFDACFDDMPEDLTNGYSLQLTVTLDNMGGTRALDEFNPMKKWEDYIDPEKFRVLFFNHNEEFLFESKSRWIKQLAPTADGFAQWLVSVPMYSYGNDINENWNWDEIRKAITTNTFKIAILANRPEKDFYPGFDYTGLPDPDWIPNIGPQWKAKDTSWGAQEGDTVKKIMDLHHCQYDPIYHGKCKDKDVSYAEDFYEFIMKDYDMNDKGKLIDPSITGDTRYKLRRPKMGVTSSWVEWELDKAGNERTGVMQYPKDLDTRFAGKSSKKKPDVDFDNEFNAIRYTVVPSAKRPIPMYGIQEFQPITHWVKGTPFNLSQITTGAEQTGYQFESIALLRSIVKLELLLSKNLFPERTEFVTLWYSNVYARCEPMDVWTSTKDLWKEHIEGECEWYNIIKYGPVVSENFEPNKRRKQNDKAKWQETMSWFYGAWMEEDPSGKKRWDFTEHNYRGNIPNNIPYPRIFNTCVQRNKTVLCNIEGDLSDEYDDNYWHFVVYTGERNMIDPNNLTRLEDKNSYAASWIFRDGNSNDSKFYAIPIAPYTKNDQEINKTAKGCFGPYTIDNFGTGSSLDLPKDNMYNYGNTVRDLSSDKNSQDEWPWPLMRNHVYRITIGPDKPANTRAATQEVDMDDFTIESHDYHSESLTPFGN